MGTVACLSGCIIHEARLDPPTAPPAAPNAAATVYVTRAGSGHGAKPFSRDFIGPMSATSPAPAPEPVRFAGTVSTGPLPISLRGDSWVRDEDGNLYRGSTVVETPLSWSQRFPIDFFTDLWPAKVVYAAEAAPVLRPVPVMASDDLTAEARAAGYCHDQRPAPTPARAVHAQ